MIIDVTGTVLLPGNGGKDCPGNGYHTGIECCCDECAYMLCCFSEDIGPSCTICMDLDCPRSSTRKVVDATLSKNIPPNDCI